MKELRATSNPGSNHAMTFGVYNDADYKTTDVSVYVDEQGNVHPNIPRSGSNLSFSEAGISLSGWMSLTARGSRM